MSTAQATPSVASSTTEMPYPVEVGSQQLTLPNSLEWIKMLYEAAGLLGRNVELTDDVLSKWFQYSTKVVPGAILKTVQQLSYPTPKGLQQISRAKVEAIFHKVYLAELEPAEVLSHYSYVELDQTRFAFAAVQELIQAGKVFDSEGQLTGLAKRDLKKNCATVSSTAAEQAPPLAATTPSISEQRYLLAVLQEECKVRWPYTPTSKSCVVTAEQSPRIPKQRTTFRALIQLTSLNRTFESGWHPIKKDAENAAADAALRFLHTLKK